MNPRPSSYTFQRYLAAKRTVDDRALNHHVWESLHHALAHRAPAEQPLIILELGGGIGTMIERLLEENRLPHTAYHLLDAQAENIQSAHDRLHKSFATSKHQPPMPPTFKLTPDHIDYLATSSGVPLELTLYTKELDHFLATAGPLSSVDLILAHAFMDLVDLRTTLPQLTATLQPGALLYFTINFDGATILEPSIDVAFDAHVEQVYHRTMDERMINGRISGDSHTGRRLFHQMQTASIHVIDAGSSDWVIIPHHGTYPHDEAYFLHFIIDTMKGALQNHPDLDPSRFQQWITERHAQIERGELIYIAHQLDYLGEYRGEDQIK
jgi:hypothetical protein